MLWGCTDKSLDCFGGASTSLPQRSKAYRITSFSTFLKPVAPGQMVPCSIVGKSIGCDASGIEGHQDFSCFLYVCLNVVHADAMPGQRLDGSPPQFIISNSADNKNLCGILRQFCSAAREIRRSTSESRSVRENIPQDFADAHNDRGCHAVESSSKVR